MLIEIARQLGQRSGETGPMTALTDDAYYFSCCATANKWDLEWGSSSAHLNGANPEKLIELAFGLLNGTGIPFSSISSLEDLVSVRMFTLVVHGGAQHLTRLEMERLVSVLLVVARHWVKLPSWHIAALLQVTDVYCPDLANQRRQSTKMTSVTAHRLSA